MQDKQIGYTTRFNAFMQNSKDYAFTGFASDGEGLTINNWLKAYGSSLNAVVDWVNIIWSFDKIESNKDFSKLIG